MNTNSISKPSWPQNPQQKLLFGNLVGSSVALLIANIARQSKKSLLIITPDMLMAQRLDAEIQFFGRDLKNCILNFPDWETLPYDIFSPHQDIISTRLKTLYQLPRLEQSILITPITTLVHRLAPVDYLNQSSFLLKVGDQLILESFRLQLQKAGYHAVQQVFTHGEFSCRGSIIDIFPMGSEIPFRIDLLGDEVDSIRLFDPETQRSDEKISAIELLPAHEFPMSEAGISLFRQNWRNAFAGNPMNCPTYQSISQGILASGIEYYLPLFFEQTQTLFDYIRQDALVITFDSCYAACEKFWQEIKERYEQHQFDVTRPLLKPESLFLGSEEIFVQLKNFSRCQIQTADSSKTPNIHFQTLALKDVTLDYRSENPLKNLTAFLNETSLRTLVLAETTGRREALLELFSKHAMKPFVCQNWDEFLTTDHPFCLSVAPLDRGFQLSDLQVAVITESELFGQQILQRRMRKSRKSYADAIVRDLSELNIGALVVHIDHGIGRYLGLQTLVFNEIEAEFLTLEYAGGDKLYVPVSSLHLINRYTGGSEHVSLHRLGGDQWQNAKRKAVEQIKDVAAELLAIYAKREAHVGLSFQKQDADYEQFSAGFPFELTIDQQHAVDDVLKDMSVPRPMDRVICGDVGFGKTEVAMRAAFIAVNNGKQVAVLVPTTLLASQHYQNFSDRFADWPIHVEMISRFRTPQAQKLILEKLKDKKIDILIGTHKLLGSDVKFNQLGLLIIDEEHRFGVQQKERLKALRSEVDILTLTATPIPRTLNMAFAGLRDLSIIATPPARRLSIKTFVQEKNNALTQEAILRELLRGGQVYFVHNNVETIERMAQEIQKLVPEARVGVAHGQMREKELENKMVDFYHQRFNVLVCTTIIETGIDIPTANTMIIDRADKFGLSQLHQLRGRVGRSHHQAYTYLIVPPEKMMSQDAKKRLEAIAMFEELGAGFSLATHDLEIRGAGELLGEAQSGSIQSIGFSLYSELLERAVSALKEGKIPDFQQRSSLKTEIDLKIPALIPEHYVSDVHLRLTLYKRISEVKDQSELDALSVEMIDRFGLMPYQTKNLFRLAALRLVASPLGIMRIDAVKTGGALEFNENPSINPVAIIELVQKQGDSFKLDGPKRLKFLFKEALEGENRVVEIENILKSLVL